MEEEKGGYGNRSRTSKTRTRVLYNLHLIFNTNKLSGLSRVLNCTEKKGALLILREKERENELLVK